MDSTEILGTTDEDIDRAARLLRAGRLVAFPTETVYGLGADATDDAAVAAVYSAKGRPPTNPLIVHVASRDAALELGTFPRGAADLAAAFWPGPLTLVVPLREPSPVSPLALAGGSHVALRVPDQPVAAALLRTAGRPLAAPSANPSGRISPTTAAHVLAGLGGRIDAILDGGPCAVGLESTVVSFADTPRLLRPGGLPLREIEAVLGGTLDVARTDDAPLSPGQLASHYAPNAAVRLEAEAPRPGEVFLGFGPGCEAAALNLSPSGDLVEAAANLFGHLHALDATGASIAVAPVPDRGLGRAINDRLRRAAAPRSGAPGV